MSRDLATLRLLKAGDAQGLARLIEDHGPHVQAHLRRKFHGTLDRWQIEDAVSLAAIRAWQSAHRFDPELGRLRAWFAVIARNCALSLVAQRRSERTVAIDDLDPAVFGYTAVDEVERMRLVLDVHRAIETLPNHVARLRGRRRLRKLLHRMGYGPGRRRNDRPPLGPESAAQ